MQKFAYWQEGLIFIIVFTIVLAIPCVLLSFLGSRLIANLGQYPTKSASYHMGTALPLLGSMIVSFLLLIAFFAYFSD